MSNSSGGGFNDLPSKNLNEGGDDPSDDAPEGQQDTSGDAPGEWPPFPITK